MRWGEGRERRTYDADLEVIAWPSEKDLLFLHGLFRRHSFRSDGECGCGGREEGGAG